MKIDLDWPQTQEYIDSSEEACIQIDMAYLVKKLMFLEAAVSKLMDRNEIQALWMRERPTLDQTREQRRVHFAPERLKAKRENDLRVGSSTEEIIN